MNSTAVSPRLATTLLIVALGNAWFPGLVPLIAPASCQAEEELFKVRDIKEGTRFSKDHADPEKRVTPADPPQLRIPTSDGAACDAQGNLLVLVYRGSKAVSIGRRSPEGAFDTLLELPSEISAGRLCRFDATNLYAMNAQKCEILKIDLQTKAVSVIAHDKRLHFLRDMVLSPDGRFFVADADYVKTRGSIWRIDPDGKVTCVIARFGLIDGMEVGPDGKLLYLSEYQQKNLWVYRIDEDGSLYRKRLVKEFHSEIRGMKCDSDGNIYVIQDHDQRIYKLSPKGEVLKEIDVLRGSQSISFGGLDGRTVYVMQGPRMVEFRADRPGRVWQSLQK